MSAFDETKIWIKANLRIFVIGIVIVVLLGLSSWAFVAYKAGKNERAQYLLATGITKFQEYLLAKKTDSLSKAESDFTQVAKIGSAGPRDAARLYLARIAAVKGNKEEAKALYEGVARNPSSDVIKKLAETGLSDIAKN